MKKIAFFSIIAFSLLLSSCASTKKVTYFQNKDELNQALTTPLYDAKIMPKDILQINVSSLTPEASSPFNLRTASGYLVNNNGSIEFPIIGTIHMAGLTIREAEELVKSKVQPYMSASENVVVHVRMPNYKFTVLGAVGRSGVFVAQNEKVNIIEAIAMAGDLSLYGQRDRIFLIRENSEGRKEYHQLNFNDANIVYSPYYYLQQNDIIYVEPRKTEARNAFISSNTSIWFSLVSSLMSITTFILALSK